MIKIGNRLIADSHDNAVSTLEKAIGLMFRSKVKRPLVFYFDEESIIPLHMMFVFTPIDVIFIAKDNRITEIHERFKPFTTFTPTRKASKIIELPPNFISRYKLKVRELVTIK